MFIFMISMTKKFHLDEEEQEIQCGVDKYFKSNQNIKIEAMNEICGTITFDKDPLVIQKELRDEWV